MVFADYQLLAAMGGLIQYVKAPPPADALALESEPFGLLPTKLPPIHLRAPTTGPEPLPVPHAAPIPALNYAAASELAAQPKQDFSNRWSGSNSASEPTQKFSDRWNGQSPAAQLIDAVSNSPVTGKAAR